MLMFADFKVELEMKFSNVNKCDAKIDLIVKRSVQIARLVGSIFQLK